MVAPWPEISDDSLLDYYKFYCSGLYKSERAHLEPEYARIADLHFSTAEIDLRRAQHEAYILPILREDTLLWKRMRLLDYGGGLGGLSPRSEWIDSDIYEVGNRERRPAYRGFKYIEPGYYAPICQEYEFVQLMHVLEHVGNPLATLRKASSFLKDGGLIYVEVPFELTDFDAICKSKEPWCDEHINKFCPESVMEMMIAAGFQCLECHSTSIQLLHIGEPIKVIRCLALKPYKSRFSSLLNEIWRLVTGPLRRSTVRKA
jgi:hypothetical protein